MSDPTQTRGYRLQNPLNIRISDNQWLGKVTPSSDPDFEQFDIPEHGVRAAAKIIVGYFKGYGLSTIDQIIGRWAPATENNCVAYCNTVSQKTGYDPGQSLNVLDPTTLTSLITGMMNVEIGGIPYAYSQIENGVAGALE